MGKYVAYRDTRGEWRFTFYASNGEAIAVSSEGYVNKFDCLHGIDLLKGSANAPVYIRDSNGQLVAA